MLCRRIKAKNPRHGHLYEDLAMEEKVLRKYHYKGPVSRYNVCVAHCWEAETLAETKEKARSNLRFRFNAECGLASYLPVTFGSDIREIRT